MAGRRDAGEHDAGIRRAVRQIEAQLDALAASKHGASEVARSKLRVVVDRCGVRRRSRRLLVDLGEALSAAGVHFEPDLTDVRLPLETVIRFSRRPLSPTVDKELFEDEYGLERYLAHNLRHTPGLEDLRVHKTQFELTEGTLIDILCRDRASGGWAVVELKRAQPDRGVYQQAIEYTRALQASPFAKGKPVRAVIISGIADQELQHDALVQASALNIDLSWYVYDISLTVSEMASTGAPSIRARPKTTPEPETQGARRRPVGHYDDRLANTRGWRG